MVVVKVLTAGFRMLNGGRKTASPSSYGSLKALRLTVWKRVRFGPISSYRQKQR